MDKRWVKITGICLGICCALFLLFLGLIANKASIQFYAPHLLFNENTIAPFRSVMESRGEVVTWNSKEQTITMEKGTDSFTISIDTDQKQGIPIYINHNYIGKSPVSKKLLAGKYLVVARPPGHVGSIRYLTLKPEKAREQQIVLPLDQHSYQDFLDEILRLGYQPIRVMDYFNQVPITDKTIVLRHDVDISALYALKMAEIEHAKGIQSTYYFRWCTVDPQIIKTVRAMGHEVGLHYETLATYAEEHRLKSAQEITPAVTEELRKRLKYELEEFKRQFGEDLYTISSHGADQNIKLGVTNYQAVMKGQNPHDYGIIGDAYEEKIIKRFSYMSDAGGIWEPFPYPQLEKGSGPFYILIHPVHWKSSF